MGNPLEEPTIPRSAGQLCTWLVDTDTGNEILREAAKKFLGKECRKCQRLQPYPKVLIISRCCEGVPMVDVYHEDGVAVRMEEMADGKNYPPLEDICTRLLALSLPKSWRKLLIGRWARQCDTNTCRELEADRVMRGLAEMQAIRDLIDNIPSKEKRNEIPSR